MNNKTYIDIDSVINCTQYCAVLKTEIITKEELLKLKERLQNEEFMKWEIGGVKWETDVN